MSLRLRINLLLAGVIVAFTLIMLVFQLVDTRRGNAGGSALDSLTPREREVLELMAEGRTNAAIARKMVVRPGAVEKLTSLQDEIGFTRVLYDDHIGKVSLIGAGMRSHPGVTATFCEALANAGINIDLISTSEIRISVLIKDTELDRAVAALHEAFGLGGDEEAVVYAGTGR